VNSQVVAGNLGGICMETTKLLGGETNILGHGSTHSNARHMGPTANERGRQTTYSIRTLDV
jgi:hypothetical protein